jgi:hypothetical protein
MLRSTGSLPFADRPETNGNPQISPTAAEYRKTLFHNMILPSLSQSFRTV